MFQQVQHGKVSDNTKGGANGFNDFDPLAP